MFGRLQPGQMPNNSQPSQSSSQAQRYRQLLPASSSSSCSSARPLPDPVNYPELQPSSFRPIARRVSTDAPAPSGRHTYPAPHMSRYPSQGRYWVSRPQPERNPTGISGGSAFGQISLLADVAAREADEERGRTRWRSTAEDASVGGPAGAWYQEDERRPSRRDAGGRAAPYPQPAHTQSRMHPSTTRSVRSPSRLRPPEEHPLAGLCLATYPTYDHTDFDADVRRILSTPILAPPVVRDSFTSIPPQWPPHQSQVHGWADPEKGRAWTFSLDPARRRPNHGEQSLSPAKGDVSTSSRPTALDSPRRPPTPLSQPEPPTKKAKTDHPSSVSTSLTSTLQSSPQSTPVGPTKTDRQTRASPQSMADSGSETGSEVDTSDLSHTSPSSSHLALGNQSGPALEESFNKIVTRAHSSSLSSAASAPVKRTQPLVGSRSTRERAKSENTKPREKKKRRGGPKRKHQNKVAARKHREKKKMLVEQLEQERDTYLSQLRQRDEEIAAIRRELEYANRELERLGGRV